MEDIITFVVLVGTGIILISASMLTFINSVGYALQAQKELADSSRDWVWMFKEGNVSAPLDKILYITEVNTGIVRVRNGGYSDVYWLRMFCWPLTSPDRGRVVSGKINGVLQPPSVELFPSGEVIEYNLYEYLDSADIDSGNVACSIITNRGISVFRIGTS